MDLLIFIILVSAAFFYKKDQIVVFLEKNKTYVIGASLLLILAYLYVSREHFSAQPWDDSIVCGERKIQELGMNSDSEPIKTEYPETSINQEFYISTPFEVEPMSIN